MSKSCLKFVIVFALTISSFLFLSAPVHAASTIDSAALNGSSSVTVEPSSEVSASVTVTIDGPSNWLSTTWDTGSGANCADTGDYTASGTYTEGFAITAPGSLGIYDVSFVAYANGTCGGGASNTYTLTGGIIVAAPTPTPTTGPASTPTPTTGPGVTATPAVGTTSDDGSTAVIFPSITLINTGLNFSGTASISEGTVDSVEYSLDEGHTWLRARASDGKFDEISEDYSFSPKGAFTQGTHRILARARSLAQVYTQSSSYATVTITVSPPNAELDVIFPNPTKDQTPTITGTASSDFTKISRVQISLDNGKTWFPAELAANKFSLTTDTLEDGNYTIKARAYDAAGNIGESETQILIIDTIPPIIGGNITALGSQMLTPDSSGTIRTIASAQNTIVVSMRGGVTKATLAIPDGDFDLSPIEGTDLWTGKIIFGNEGESLVKIIAVDGADNKTERDLNSFLIEKSGTVVNSKDNTALKDAEVSLFFFETTSETWVTWEGSSFGQKILKPRVKMEAIIL